MVGEVRWRGRALFGGVVVGAAYLDSALLDLEVSAAPVAPGLDQVARLDQAIGLVREHLREHVRSSHLAADEDLHRVLAAHQMVLDDQLFFDGIRTQIRSQGLRAEDALEEAFRTVVSRLALARDSYLRGRIEDLRDICQSLREALLRGEAPFTACPRFAQATIFVTANLHPSTVMRAHQAGAVGFVTSSRATSSHGVILLRGSEIPSLAAVELDLHRLRDGQRVLLDANDGELVLEPEPATIEARQRRVDVATAPAQPAEAHGVVHTASGQAVSLWANIDNPAQAAQCPRHLLRGVGLLRTEFMVMQSGRPPDEAEQFATYRELLRQLAGCPLVVRSYDLGGGKLIASLHHEVVANPALGLRGLRRHLHLRPDELRTQVRALLRASEGGDVTVLLPMVTTPGDVARARSLILDEAEALAARGVPHNRQLKIAAMIEVPAAALQVREILPLVNSITIGTNDLSQYLAAADRENAAVSAYLTPEATALYRMLALIFDQARELGRLDDVRVGGELASDPEAVPRLVAAGARHLIVVPSTADAVRRAVAATRVG